VAEEPQISFKQGDSNAAADDGIKAAAIGKESAPWL
jgi:hypothetical protein